MNYKLIVILLLPLLSGCDPVYRTEFELISPPSDYGRMCVTNCMVMQQNCRNACSIQMQQCAFHLQLADNDAHDRADRDYDDYVQQRKSQGKQIKKTRNDFYFSPSDDCGQNQCNSLCTNDFNSCYTYCGGRVIPHIFCVANCDTATATGPTMR